ncbi:serine/threonine-protein kinase [Teredinibacter sp. KSP-S5-2]|uniref:serine/threonine-protein kinase n=1 Tax=Teredinibacter sp. KSP-S5-2 TaxID=3034506 RepID=UPI002934F3B8|nr:serine/threonine-protein kinase [Teredinibacter sp. KSP-S5-2]WNO09892.1 serine/threonine-protein kinase [Teredinibacter sp. KSP-S5-2]
MPGIKHIAASAVRFPVIFVSHLSLRGLVLIIGVALLMCPWKPAAFAFLDNYILQASTYFLPSPKGASEIAVIEVPPREFESWQQDVYSAGKLGALISNILHGSDATVGVVLNKPLDSLSSSADQLLEDLAAQSNTENETLVQVRSLVQRKHLLLDTLNNDRVILGVVNTRLGGHVGIESNPGRTQVLPDIVNDWLWPAEWRYVDPGRLVERPSIDHHTVVPEAANARTLVIYDDDNTHTQGSFSLYLLKAALERSGTKIERVSWLRDWGVLFDDQTFRTSPSGSVVALNSVTTERMHPLIGKISLEEAMARSAFPAIVIVAAAGDQTAMSLARSTYSMLHGFSVAEPWWFVGMEKALLLFFTLYLVWLLPKLSPRVGYVISLFLLFALVVLQIFAVVNNKLWYPLGLSLLFLMVGHILIIAWRRREQSWINLQDRADSACVVLAEAYMERQDYDMAAQAMSQCGSSSKVLGTLYDIASAYAGEKQYQHAVDVFKSISAKSVDYRDTSQKIDALKTMIYSSQSSGGNGSVELDATVALERQPLPMQKLGRYEVREEIGRGAMGTVYLGYDPRIARKVAVKTLNTSQFSSQQIGDIKSRFFREAEAAGRLSHPRIVSVYDVGEEGNLAYIAMDFVDGKALNEFVSPDRLLPVFEVYRVVCDVAEALEYAHSNQIIHRDIKPGNIMYNPAPYQVKVTDFGIARLVDDSKTSTGEILGSPLYMAPEQLKGKKVNFAADVFSLGVTFYQLLTGVLPFSGDNLASLTYEIIHGKHKNVRRVRRELPASAARIINQCLQKDPTDRYASAGELAQTIRKAIKRDFAHDAKRIGYL